MKKVFYLLFCIMVVSNLHGQTWTGTTSTSWNIPTNWNPTGVPTGASNVIIPGSVVSNNWPVFAGNVTINSINMQTGSQLNVNGFTLTTLPRTMASSLPAIVSMVISDFAILFLAA